MRRSARVVAVLLPLFAGGCLARTAVTVVTLPVKATAKAVDWTTTSRSEADRNAGSRMRKDQEHEARERKRWDKQCRKHQRDDCDRYDGVRATDPRR